MKLSIHILHNLTGRVRIRFSRPLKHIEKLKLHVMEHEGIDNMLYTPVTQSMLVSFNANVIELQEIMIRTAVAYSAENSLKPVKITQKNEKEFITTKGIIAGVFIAAAGIAGAVTPGSPYRRVLEWMGAVTTGTAVLEHAGYDFRKKGSVDPEVFSLVFLVNWALSGKNMLLPSALTWVTTFGRHFSSGEGEGIVLEIDQISDDEEHPSYEVNVSKLHAKNNYLDILNVLAEKFLSSNAGFDNTIFEKSKSLLKTHNKNLEGIGDKIKGIVLNFNG